MPESVGPGLGRWRYTVADDRWAWSDAMFRIYGFEPGEVVPTSDLLSTHTHPDFRATLAAAIQSSIATGESLACRHRIIDAAHRTRTVVMVGEAVGREGGTAPELQGFLADVTSELARDESRASSEAVQAAVEHRALIEQAKGALMFGYGVDADEAFRLLAHYSQEGNVKLNRLAEQFVAELVRSGDTPPAGRTTLTQLLADALRQVATGGQQARGA